MRRTLGLFVVGLAALACALPFSTNTPTGSSPTPAPAASAAPTLAPASDEPAAEPPVNEPGLSPTETSPTVTSLPDPQGYSWQPVVTNLTKPLGLEHAGDERLFIVQQAGLIGIYRDGQLLAEPFLDIRDRVLDSGFEQGLLGLAFHPQFADNGNFYVNYTSQGGDTRIARFNLSGNPDVADPDSEQIILSFSQPYANHNGGGLSFGPDGYLYIGTGDGGSANDPQGNAQSLDTLLGKMLRIDVNANQGYGIPEDNPLLAQDEARPEIWAYGLRNPWRFTFDSQTGDLYIADVGQNQWEEINFEAAASSGGLNYGWDRWEGTHVFEGGGDGTVMPVAEYSHQLGCSVTGGVVVRAPSSPSWNGVYIYGDFCSGNIWGLVRDQNGQWQNELLFQTDFSPSAFGVDVAGEVYLVDHNGGLYRLNSVE